MLNTIPDTGAVVTALELYIGADLGVKDFFQEYTTSHVYPLGYSILIFPGMVVGWVFNFWANSGQSFDFARFDGIGLAFLSARFVNLILFAVGAVYLQKIIKFFAKGEKISKICFALYVFSPLSLLYSFQERPHLPAGLLMVPLIYYGLQVINNKKKKDAMIAGVLAGLTGSIIQYGFIVFIGLFFGIFLLVDVVRKEKIKLLFFITLSCFVTAAIFGYPGLFFNPFSAFLNQTHTPYVAFNGTGFIRIIHALWIYEPLILLYLIFAIYCNHKFGRKYFSELSLLILPSLVFFIVFGMYSNFEPRQVGGMFTLLIVAILFLWKSDIKENIFKITVYVSGLAAFLITFSGLFMKPSYELVYDYLAEQSVDEKKDDILTVVDNVGITSYLDPLSEVITGFYVSNNEIPNKLNPYRRFNFAIISLRGRKDPLDVANKSKANYIITDGNMLDSSGEFKVIYQSPYEGSGNRFIPFHVKFPGRQKVLLYSNITQDLTKGLSPNLKDEKNN